MYRQYDSQHDKFGLMPKVMDEFFGGGGGRGGGGGCVQNGVITGLLGTASALAVGSNIRDGALIGALSGATSWAACAGGGKNK